jgi:hypothetical protein
MTIITNAPQNLLYLNLFYLQSIYRTQKTDSFNHQLSTLPWPSSALYHQMFITLPKLRIFQTQHKY